MLSFESDYTEGAHEAILEAFAATNREQLPGYGADRYTLSAIEKIRAACGCPDASVTLLTGGTQTNALVISALLKNYEGVVSADTGHVFCHEAGAIEYTGHKVLTVPGHNGKMEADELRALIEGFYADENHEHMVFPGMVYISYPTEYGTIYSKAELAKIYAVCRSYEIPLYIDGARLGYGLMSPEADLTLPELASLCDVFYIGGTKVGALCGEAVVFPRGNAPAHFVTTVKQHGALCAKGRLAGIQFDVLFTDDLYFQISRHAIEMAQRLKAVFEKKGYRFHLDSPTNQQFIVLENTKMKELGEHVRFSFWEPADETHTVVRFATSWATEPGAIDELERLL